MKAIARELLNVRGHQHTVVDDLLEPAHAPVQPHEIQVLLRQEEPLLTRLLWLIAILTSRLTEQQKKRKRQKGLSEFKCQTTVDLVKHMTRQDVPRLQRQLCVMSAMWQAAAFMDEVRKTSYSSSLQSWDRNTQV